MSSSEDAGLALLSEVRTILELEGTRVRDEERAFRWWPHAHAMRFSAGEPRPDGASVVAAETLLLEGVPGRGPEFGRIALRNARDPGLSSLRWDSTTAELWLRAAVIARPGDSLPAAKRLAHAALLQAGEALRASDALAVEFPEARLATPPAPVAGLPVVEQVEAWQAYAERAPGLAAGLAERVSALASASPAPWLRVSRAPHGLDAEIACAPPHQQTAPGEGVALLRLSATQAHPRLGAGLVMVLVPPPAAEPVAERAAATSVMLNEAEAREWTGVDALGGWCVHGSVGLSHVTFVPALAIDDDTVEVLAWQAGVRARWAVAFLQKVAAMRTPGGANG